MRGELLCEVPDRLRERYLQRLVRVDPQLAVAVRRVCDAADSEPAGTRFGRFRRQRRLGGGPVEVWLAVDEVSDRPVVLKTGQAPDQATSGAPGAIGRECAASAKLQFDAVPRVLETGRLGDVDYLVREFVPGTALSEWIDQRRRDLANGMELSGDEIREMIACLVRTARLVGEVHAAGWVHGDLKPGNLLIGTDGRAWLLDLGCAARIGTRLCDSGSPAYAAPERIADPSPLATAAIDVWALGVTLFECIALHLPFDADGRDSLLAEILSAPLNRRIARVRWHVRGLEAVVRWSLERNSDRRCPSAFALADDLERVLASAPTHAARTLRRRRLVRAGRWLALVAALGAALFALAIAGRASEPGPSSLLSTRWWVDVAEREAETIWPAWPENAPRLQNWLERHADPLRARRDALALALARDHGADRDRLRSELANVERFLDPTSGTLADVERRLATSSRLAVVSLEASAADWRAAAMRIAADPRFEGFRLGPLVGLVPLGRDPDSDLEEFHDLASAEIGWVRPERDRAGRIGRDPRHGVILVLVPGGRFRMGEQRADPNAPAFDEAAGRHSAPESVAVSAFLMSKYELTNDQWRRLSGKDTPSYLQPGTRYGTDPPITGSHPVEQVSWDEARRELARGGLDLPTESQWEVAAASGTATRFSFGTATHEFVHYGNVRDASWVAHFGEAEDALDGDDGFVFTAPIGSFAPNAFGLHDMHGNVAEWCRDAWDDYGAANPPRAGDGLRTPEGIHRAYRGGSYAHAAVDARTRLRMDDLPTLRSPLIGIRPIRPWPGEPR